MADEQEKEDMGEDAPGAQPPEVGSPQAEAAAEPETLEAAKALLQQEKEEAQRFLANWQRAEADFVNYKRRVEQERGEAMRLASAALIINILPVLDDLERALTNLDIRLVGLTWFDGVRLIYRKLQLVLESAGVSQIEAERPRPPPGHGGGGQGEGAETVGGRRERIVAAGLQPCPAVPGRPKGHEENSGAPHEMLRFAQHDSESGCHPERSEGSLLTLWPTMLTMSHQFAYDHQPCPNHPCRPKGLQLQL
jgi:molecular chaperone GrpE